MVRKVDDSTPRGKKKVEKFLNTPTFAYKDGKAKQQGTKWTKITKAEFDKAINNQK